MNDLHEWRKKNVRNTMCHEETILVDRIDWNEEEHPHHHHHHLPYKKIRDLQRPFKKILITILINMIVGEECPIEEETMTIWIVGLHQFKTQDLQLLLRKWNWNGNVS
jgi:hypothetical protein